MNFRVLNKLILIFLISIGFSNCVSNREIAYKEISEDNSLKIKLNFPKEYSKRSNKIYPCAVFISGGGWKDFSWNQLVPLSNKLSEAGYITAIIEYRTSNKYLGATPFQALEDVENAIAYLRNTSEQYNIDSNNIIAIGSSAGGHLALTASLHTREILGQNNLHKPNFVIALSPVLRNDQKGYGFDRIGENYKWFSPYNYYATNLDVSLPPTLIISGENDRLIPFEDLKMFKFFAAEKGDAVTLYMVKDAGHAVIEVYKNMYDLYFPIVMEFLEGRNINYSPIFVKESQN